MSGIVERSSASESEKRQAKTKRNRKNNIKQASTHTTLLLALIHGLRRWNRCWIGEWFCSPPGMFEDFNKNEEKPNWSLLPQEDPLLTFGRFANKGYNQRWKKDNLHKQVLEFQW